jgi:hypothetical protein
VVAAAAGAAFGEILTAILVSGVGLEWWPGLPTVVLVTFIFGYMVPDRQTG